jgi:hypothetical protein
MPQEHRPQVLYIGLDTGSADLWVTGAGCTSCTAPGTRFNSTVSSTFRTVGPPGGVDISYAVGEVMGQLTSDVVTMGGLTIQSQEFGQSVSLCAWVQVEY